MIIFTKLMLRMKRRKKLKEIQLAARSIVAYYNEPFIQPSRKQMMWSRTRLAAKLVGWGLGLWIIWDSIISKIVRMFL